MAMDMMRLDDLEKAIVINTLREQFLHQEQQDSGIKLYEESPEDENDFESVPDLNSTPKEENE